MADQNLSVLSSAFNLTTAQLTLPTSLTTVNPAALTTNSNNVGVDRRVRISARPTSAEQGRVYGDNVSSNLLQILYSTNGIIFPYTPSISMGVNAEYDAVALTHSIQTFYSYTRTPSPEFNISGTFTAQFDQEAHYCLSVMHFLRTVTKMYFGSTTSASGASPATSTVNKTASSKLGNTPPTLLLNGHGNGILNNLPIIIKGYSFDYPEDVDYYHYKFSDSIEAYIPIRFKITINVAVQRAPYQAKQFNLDSFRTGALLGTYKYGSSNNVGGWW